MTNYIFSERRVIFLEAPKKDPATPEGATSEKAKEELANDLNEKIDRCRELAKKWPKETAEH